MIISTIKPRTIIVLFALAAIGAASVYIFQNTVSASGFSGKIYTSLFDGQFVHVNKYSSKDAVYLNGGQVQQNANGLPDGTYYFQVTGPSGNDLLSTDLAVCRQVIVFNGVIAAAEGPACQHPTGIPQSDGSLPVKLMPFNDTPNPGGNYKAWLIRQTGNTSVAADGIHINFQNSNAKQEIFRVDPVPCTDNCGPTVTLGGKNFYDLNENGSFDPDEAPLEGVQILVLAGADTTVVTTNAAGIWSLPVSTGVEFLILEFLPFTGPSGEPGSYWQQTAPVADDDGLRSYVGTANADLAVLNFGNICFNPDSQGIPVKALTPCPVSNLPPPEPTPSPTPTPCTEDCPTAVLSGQKFYDANSNALRDEGEDTVQGVQIAVVLVTGEGVTLTFATTNADGNWSLTVPAGAQYLISEYLPDTDPELESGGFWEQTAPLPNEEGFRGYSGTASADQSGLNFGNICFYTDSEGNPFAQPTPCTVRYPAPTPTPTPTPTPPPTPEQ
jgi:hypothetical protein